MHSAVFLSASSPTCAASGQCSIHITIITYLCCFWTVWHSYQHYHLPVLLLDSAAFLSALSPTCAASGECSIPISITTYLCYFCLLSAHLLSSRMHIWRANNKLPLFETYLHAMSCSMSIIHNSTQGL